MAQRNRETLKNYFRQGKRPGEQEFEDLIDSTLNTLDDGYAGSPQTGIELTPQTHQGTVISIYRNPEDTKSVWEIAVDKNTADLQIRRCRGEESELLATLKYQHPSMPGIPEMAFTGTVSSKGRKGTFKTGSVCANGEWQDIFCAEDYIEPGCWAFEIVAGCGERHKGRYALAVALAVNCFGDHPKVHTVQSHFGQWGNKIKFRWKKIKGENHARLQVRSRSRYDDGVKIQYQVCNLWDNPFMVDRE